uniref:Leucine-rich repeat-containing protein 17 n=1 Tax=Leptobrachium leishanense TaxID=445787 RepID=A0A8C5QHB3_9ANUR
MRVVTLIMLLFFCQVYELKKIKRNHRGNNDKQNKKYSSTVKRYAPGSPCDIYTHHNEKYMDCQETKQTTISSEWPEDLIHILLARNRIRILKNNVFSQFKNLKSVDLQQNDITKIETQAFSGLKKLTTLLLQHNRIRVLSEEVFINMPRLTYLRLYDNPWDCNCELESLIMYLQLPKNRNLGNYAKCETPDQMMGQKLRQVSQDVICQEDTTGPSKIEGPKVIRPSVDSSRCHLYLHPTVTLDCRRKELHIVPSDIAPDIVKFDLSHNKIKELRSKEFTDVPNLEILNLSNNRIEHIDPAAFAGLLSLQELDLTNNSLVNFQYGVLEDLYFLKHLWLRDNPWRCDYNIHYLFYWLKHHYSVHYNGLECKAPQEYKGWFVGRYVRSYYEECPKDRLQDHTELGMGEGEWEQHIDGSKQMEKAKAKTVLLTILS